MQRLFLFCQDAALSTEERRPATGAQPAAEPEAASLQQTDAGKHLAVPVAAPSSGESQQAEHVAGEMQRGAESTVGPRDGPHTAEKPKTVSETGADAAGGGRQQPYGATGVAAAVAAAGDAAAQVQACY